MTSAPLTAEDVIAHLKLKPHPEGGWYRETFRDEEGHKGRAHSTAILFLLKAGEASRWHRVDAVEIWHWHGGAPLLLEVKQGETRHEYRIGPNLLAGEHPQGIVLKLGRVEPARLHRCAGLRLRRLRIGA